MLFIARDKVILTTSKMKSAMDRLVWTFFLQGNFAEAIEFRGWVLASTI
jgi:hypothetical protein